MSRESQTIDDDDDDDGQPLWRWQLAAAVTVWCESLPTNKCNCMEMAIMCATFFALAAATAAQKDRPLLFLCAHFHYPRRTTNSCAK